jgi:PAS domain S-box-containing protein
MSEYANSKSSTVRLSRVRRRLTRSPHVEVQDPKCNELQTEIAALQRELLELRQEKADLEILLEATAEHSDSVEAELHNTAIAALKQSEEMFRTIAEATPVPVLISRIEDGAVLYANMAASTTFGIPSADFSNHSTSELYHDPGDRQKLLAALECDGCVESFELQCKRANGSLFWVAASLRRLIFNDEPTFLTALCDITQRKLEEEALKRQVREMQIEIDHTKLKKQVAEIVESDYFQQIQAEVAQLRYLEDED